MKILKKAIGKKYEVMCRMCGSILEVTTDDFITDYPVPRCIECPVCIDIFCVDISKPIFVYEDQEEMLKKSQ